MIVYLAPFTMPDGSVRRPIVERVPETMPKGLSVITEESQYLQVGTIVHEDVEPCCSVDGEHLGPGQVSPGIALALCRVAVEHGIIGGQCDGVLIGNECVALLWDWEDPAFWLEPPDGLSEPDTDERRLCWWNGETVDHALNAAAHAVADALGVPH